MVKADSIKKESKIVLICDTRQQAGKHRNVDAYCQRMGIKTIRQKLEVGDYMFPHDEFWSYPMISVDTKESILELSKNIMSDDHKRFKAECIRAREKGIQLVVLVEELPPYGRLDMWEVPRFKNTDRFHKSVLYP